MRLLLIDNYDSFTYNLNDYLLQLDTDVVVARNDALSPDGFVSLEPSAIILSPGPGRPGDAGHMMALIEHFYDKIPILGICLGHQAIGEFFGATLKKSRVPVHGKTSLIQQYGNPVFKGLPQTFEVMRYHSLIIEGLADTDLNVEARTIDGEIMAISHEKYPVFGIQYHPESVLTDFGLEVLENWIETFVGSKRLIDMEREVIPEHR